LAPSTSLRINSKRNKKIPAADLTLDLSEGVNLSFSKKEGNNK
jgi:hypothetical protein